MTEFKRVTISADDIAELEAAGEALFRARESTAAIRLLAIALRFREYSGLSVDPVVELDGEFSTRVPSNVVELSDYLGISGRPA
jgi:hypothetical protein